MYHWGNWKLKNKIAATFTLLFFVAVFILGSLTYVLTSRAYKMRTLQLVHTSIAQMSTTIDLYMQDMERLSLSIFSDPIIQRVMRAPTPDLSPQNEINEMNFQLLQLSLPWTYIQGIYLFADDGRLFNFSKGSDVPRNYSIQQEPWYSVINTEWELPILFWPTGPETTAIKNPHQVFSFIRSINDIATFPAKRLGYLKIDLNVQVMKSFLINDAVLKENQGVPLRYLLLDGQQNVIYDSQDALTGHKLPAQFSSELLHKEGELIWSDKEYLFSTYKSSYNKWTIMAIAPYSEVVKQSVNVRNLIMILGAFTLILVGIASYMLSSGVTRPLTSLIRTMKRVEMGDFKVRALPVVQHSEIGRLSQVFNMMLENVDKLINQVFQSDIREKDAQLMALQAQINPHMLFNTLNIMKACSRKKEVHEVADMAESLADLFRYSMNGWNQPVTLAEEMEHIDNYIRIQKIRFQHRLEYRSFVPESLMNVQVVKLSLQPLIENAVFHGLEQQLEGGEVELQARVLLESPGRREELEISVSDNGVGMPEEKVRQLNALFRADDIQMNEVPGGKSGIGLLNIHKRTRLMFGAPYGLHIASQEGAGTKIFISIPLRRS